jgi:hypothetical protein
MSLSDWGEALDKVIDKVDYDRLNEVNLIDEGAFKAALWDIKVNLDVDHQLLLEDQDVFFGDPKESELGENGAKLAAVFEKWRDGDRPPSMVSVLMFAADGLGIAEDSPAFQAALLAGVSGEIKHDNGYHDNHHFREVTASMLRLLVTNNDLAMQGVDRAPLLDTENQAKSLLAAAAHDQNHDGTGNVVDGQHVPYRLEGVSVNTVEPFEVMVGMSASDIEDVKTMILVTDVSAEKGGISPHGVMKDVLLKADTANPVAPKDLTPELRKLATDPELQQMAAMLSDADLTPSAGTSYEYNQRMTVNLNKEVPFITPGPDTTKFFCQIVVGGEFSSVAGQVQSNSAIAKKIGQAEDLIAKRDIAATLGNDNKSGPSATLENNG